MLRYQSPPQHPGDSQGDKGMRGKPRLSHAARAHAGTGQWLLGTFIRLLSPCQDMLLVPMALALCPRAVVLASGLWLVLGAILGALESPTAPVTGPAPPLGAREVIARATGGEAGAVGPPTIAKATGPMVAPVAQGAPVAHVISIT